MALDLSKPFVGGNANGAAKGHPILSSFYVWPMYGLLFERAAPSLCAHRQLKSRVANVRPRSRGWGLKRTPYPGSDTRSRQKSSLLRLSIDQGAAATASPRGTRFPDLAEKGAGPPRDGRTAPETSAQATSRRHRYRDGECSRRGQSPDNLFAVADSQRLL